jgi:hypothetical protein
MELLQNSETTSVDVQSIVSTDFKNVNDAIHYCIGNSKFHPTVQFWVAIEFLGVNENEDSYDISNFCIHEDFGRNYRIEGEDLKCQLFLKDTGDNQLENVLLGNASMALELQIPLESIWLVLAKTFRSEHIIYRG